MAKDNQDYETKFQELELIIAELQSSDLGLDNAVEKYEKGISLIGDLEKHLKEVKNKVTKIKQSPA